MSSSFSSLPSIASISSISSRFFFRSGPPHALALFRIGFAAFLLFYWSLKLPHVAMIFSKEGIVLPYLSASDLPQFLAPIAAAPSAVVAQVLFLLFLLSLTLLLLGSMTRTAAFVAFAFTAYYWNLSLHLFGTSFDQLFLFILLVLGMSPADRTLSIAMMRRHGSVFAWEPAPVTIQRVLALQVSAVYLGVGWQKLLLPDWQSGEILVQGFMGRWATPLAYRMLRLNLPLAFYDASVVIVKCFELLLPFGLWIRRFGIRYIFFAGATIFFIGIALFLAIWWFLVLIPACVLFLEPEEAKKFSEWFLRRKL